MRIGLLSCTSMKQPYPCKASKMYEASPRFKLAYQYAKTSCDAIYILSAKYGLIHEDTLIEPYNETLNEKSNSERKDWARHVLLELGKKHSLQTDEYLILAGMKYCEFILPYLGNYDRPLSGVSLGNWIPTLTAMLKDQEQGARTSDCDRLHEVFNLNKSLTPQIKEKALTEISSESSLINRSGIFHNKASTHDIKEYILSKISDARQQNIDYIDLVSGGIHRELGLSNCMPSVCSAMRQVMGRQGTILRKTPSGNSSTITIRYYTKE